MATARLGGSFIPAAILIVPLAVDGGVDFGASC
jgi:hypothetical protein